MWMFDHECSKYGWENIGRAAILSKLNHRSPGGNLTLVKCSPRQLNTLRKAVLHQGLPCGTAGSVPSQVWNRLALRSRERSRP